MSRYKFYRDPVEAFWHFVKKGKQSECWEWQGNYLQTGYGRIKLKGKPHTAHRLSWELHVGSIPPGLFICHRCDNKGCVNPRHLYVGTPMDNFNDSAARGRVSRGDNHWTRKYPEKILRGERHPRARLTALQVEDIRRRYSEGEGSRALATAFAVHQSTINRVTAGKHYQ